MLVSLTSYENIQIWAFKRGLIIFSRTFLRIWTPAQGFTGSSLVRHILDAGEFESVFALHRYLSVLSRPYLYLSRIYYPFFTALLLQSFILAGTWLVRSPSFCLTSPRGRWNAWTPKDRLPRLRYMLVPNRQIFCLVE